MFPCTQERTAPASLARVDAACWVLRLFLPLAGTALAQHVDVDADRREDCEGHGDGPVRLALSV